VVEVTPGLNLSSAQTSGAPRSSAPTSSPGLALEVVECERQAGASSNAPVFRLRFVRSPSRQLLADLLRQFLPVGFLVVVEVCLLMLAGWLCAGLAVQHPEAGLLAGVVGFGARFHWSMALFLDAPPPGGDRWG
jgi:hypothetical protein